ncbi:MAG: hypothetical protein J6S38_02015 [Erysipelotrichaceae bacterium]|nr:hypothetical protein [Erysipelotrichaceae bacterium]MBP5279836.1 hypothetical protein [Erysipelotrichaceae bacterium]
MIIKLNELINLAKDKVYPVDIRRYDVKENVFLRRLENVEGDISFYYDAADELRINYHLTGEMVCPCAISLEDVYVPFDLSEDEKIVHKEEEDGFYFNEDKQLEDLVMYIIWPEVPIKVVKKEKIEYSRGDGWSFVSEKDYESSREDEIDPRLQKLMEYKVEEDD